MPLSEQDAAARAREAETDAAAKVARQASEAAQVKADEDVVNDVDDQRDPLQGKSQRPATPSAPVNPGQPRVPRT